MAEHPWSQTWPIEIKPVFFIARKRCLTHAAGGRVGMLSCWVWVLDMCDLLGNSTFTGVTTGTLLVFKVESS